MEFGIGPLELGGMSSREYMELWDAKLAQEKRRDFVSGILVWQMGTLVAMVANTGMLQWDGGPRKPTEFMPEGWMRRLTNQPEPEPEDMDSKLRRMMPMLKAYQDGQVAAGL